MEIEIQLIGVNELIARYKRARQVIQDELTRSMRRVVIEGERLSKGFAPKWRNHLARSITHSVTPMSGSVQGEWGTSQPYGRFMEEGTRRHFVPAQYIGEWAAAHGFGYTGIIVSGKARPFMKPAFAIIRGKVAPEFRGAVSRIIANLRGG